MMMMMHMYFWRGNDVTYLFENISSDSSSSYSAGIIVTFVLGVTIELISYCRKYIHMKAQLHAINSSVRMSQNSPVIEVRISCTYRLMLTLVYIVMVTLGFFLMLIVMTYNVGLFFSAAGGLALGNLLFSLIDLP